MIYQIKDKYYINVAPYVYTEIEFRLDNDNLILVPTDRKIEVYKLTEVKQIFFPDEKENLKKKLFTPERKKQTKKSKKK